MFGLFKKRMSNQRLLKMQRLAAEALGGIDGAYNDGKLVFKGFVIDVTDSEEHKAIVTALRKYFQRLSQNPDNLAQDLNDLDAERKATTDTTNAETAAYAILAALLKMNVMCKWALVYWDDKRARALTGNVLGINGETLDAILRGGETGDFDPLDAPSQEIYSELIYINRFTERLIGI